MTSQKPVDLDPQVWALISNAALAAAAADLMDYRASLLQFKYIDNNQLARSIHYLYFLIGARVRAVVGVRSDDEVVLLNLGRDVYTFLSSFSKVDLAAIQGLIADVYPKGNSPAGPRGVEFVGVGTLVLGALLDHESQVRAVEQLAEIRAPLAEWHTRRQARKR
jgi:hypothetical protein